MDFQKIVDTGGVSTTRCVLDNTERWLGGLSHFFLKGQLKAEKETPWALPQPKIFQRKPKVTEDAVRVGQTTLSQNHQPPFGRNSDEIILQYKIGELMFSRDKSHKNDITRLKNTEQWCWKAQINRKIAEEILHVASNQNI